VGASGEHSTRSVSGWLEEVAASTWRIFSGLIIVIWFSREWLSHSLGRSPDLLTGGSLVTDGRVTQKF
jgi:hypothetical protein